MLSSRYQTSFGYGPRMGVGAYQPRNALAGIYQPPPPDGEIDDPIGLPEPEAEPTPTPTPRPEPAPTITNPPPRGNPEGNGVGFGGGEADSFDPGDGYGTGGPKGAPGTGNFFADLESFERDTRGLLGPMAALGPLGIPAAALGIFGLGALNAFAPETAARVAPTVIGYSADPVNDPTMGNPGDTPTPAGGNFGAGANVTGGNFADPSMESTPDASGSSGFGGESPGGGLGGTGLGDVTGQGFDGSYGGPGAFGGYGDFGGFGGYGGDNGGGGSQGESAGNGTGDNAGDSKRYGGITRHDTDGVLDEVPIRAHENEYVVRPEATMHYGEDIMHALNSGMIPRNALMGLAMARRPTASNHLLQMMMR